MEMAPPFPSLTMLTHVTQQHDLPPFLFKWTGPNFPALWGND